MKLLLQKVATIYFMKILEIYGQKGSNVTEITMH